MNQTTSSQSAEQTANEQRLQELWQKAVRFRIDEKKSSVETVASLELLGVPHEGAKMLVAEIDAKLAEAKGKARNALRKAEANISDSESAGHRRIRPIRTASVDRLERMVSMDVRLRSRRRFHDAPRVDLPCFRARPSEMGGGSNGLNSRHAFLVLEGRSPACRGLCIRHPRLDMEGRARLSRRPCIRFGFLCMEGNERLARKPFVGNTSSNRE